jgi:hypothetical protein
VTDPVWSVNLLVAALLAGAAYIIYKILIYD